MVKNGYFTFLLTSSWSRMAIGRSIPLGLTYSGQECHISHCYWHVAGQEWQFHIATGIKWSRMPIAHCYWHLVVKNEFKFIRSTLVLTSSGQDEFKFARSTPRSAGRSTPVLTSSGQDEFKFGRSTTPWYWHLVVKMSSNLADLSLDLPGRSTPHGTDI